MKLNSFCTAKEMVSKVMVAIHQTRDWKQEYTGSSKTKLPKNQWPNKEMDNWTEQNFFKGRNPNG
jgi:hypothetical protein